MAGRHMIEMQDALADKIVELREVIAQIRTLRGIVPICGNCKKIRDDEDYWHPVEAYVRHHTEAEFSHGICPQSCGNCIPNSLKTAMMRIVMA